jgi:predicted homoserine dehydrogenase-like protein
MSSSKYGFYRDYVDGSQLSNNPSMCSISESIKLGSNIDTLHNLNISLNDYYKKKQSQKEASVQGTQRIVEYQAHQLIGFRNHVIKASKHDIHDFNKMRVEANVMWDSHRKSVLDKYIIV